MDILQVVKVVLSHQVLLQVGLIPDYGAGTAWFRLFQDLEMVLVMVFMEKTRMGARTVDLVVVAVVEK